MLKNRLNYLIVLFFLFVSISPPGINPAAARDKSSNSASLKIRKPVVVSVPICLAGIALRVNGVAFGDGRVVASQPRAVVDGAVCILLAGV